MSQPISRPVVVYFEHNSSDDLYVATSPDVPGLVVEEATYGQMKAAVEVLVPVLLEVDDGADIPIDLIAHLVAHGRPHALCA